MRTHATLLYGWCAGMESKGRWMVDLPMAAGMTGKTPHLSLLAAVQGSRIVF